MRLAALVDCAKDGSFLYCHCVRFKVPVRIGSAVSGLGKQFREGGGCAESYVLQKSGPTAVGALNVDGSHSSKATTWATPGESSRAAPPANSKHKRMNPDFTKLSLIAISFLRASATHTTWYSELNRSHQLYFRATSTTVESARASPTLCRTGDAS